MRPEDIVSAVSAGLLGDFEGLQLRDCSVTQGYLVVGGLAAVPAHTISSSIDDGSDIEILDRDQFPLATLCFTVRLGLTYVSELTKYQFVAYLADVSAEDIGATQYRFSADYVIVEADRLDDYIRNYRDSSPIWGRFGHDSINSLAHPHSTGTIIATPDIAFPTKHHKEAIGRYLRANNPLERYLRLYQCIELLFDYIIYRRIQKLGDNLQGFSEVMTEHGKSELDRLKAITKLYCMNTARLSEIISSSSAFQKEREALFFVFGKAGNPITDESKWNRIKLEIDNGTLNDASVRAVGVSGGSFRQFVADLTAYWIYRIRCSIAHSRVGEYILTDDDAEFVAVFAEPLVLEVIRQVFSNPDFTTLSQ